MNGNEHPTTPDGSLSATAQPGPDVCTPQPGAGGFPKPALLLILFLLCTLPGLVGREPWKADEAYSFGMVLEMLQTGNWVVPTLGGEPFMEKPPIMYITSALSAKCLAPFLPLHDAARGSVVWFNLLTFLALGLAARELLGGRFWWLAPVLFLGAVGPLHNQHMLMTDVALLTGFAMAQAGWALSLRRPRLGGLLLGTGLGVAFLAKGLLGPGLIGLTTLALLLFKPWRTRHYLVTLFVAGLATLPWVVFWPWLLYRHSPALFYDWFWVNNFGRFLGTNGLGPKNQPFFYLRLLPAFALPVWPLALWFWWRQRRACLQSPIFQITSVSFLIMLLVLTASADGRSLYAQPMLVPLCLAAVPAVDWLHGRLRQGIGLVLSVVFITFLIGAWIAWAAILSGIPAVLQALVVKQIPTFNPSFELWPFLGGLIVTATACFCWRRAPQNAEGSVLRWTTAAGLAYGIAMTLYLPILNANMDYRTTFTALRDHLPPAHEPLGSDGLGEPQRGLLHYYAGVRTLRLEVHTNAVDVCPIMLVQGNYRDGHKMAPPPGGPWSMIWEGRRGGRESFRLYQRNPVK